MSFLPGIRLYIDGPPDMEEPIMLPADAKRIPTVRLSLAELTQTWRAVLQWGPCLCQAMDGETCPSCANAKRIEDAGLDWQVEYDRAIQAGDAIPL